MQNTKLIFITLIVSFVLYLGFEISAGKINFGSAFWSDTLSNRITTNKAINLRPGDSLYYNGNVVTSGSGTSIDTNKYLSIYRLDTANIGFLSQPNSWTTSNEFSSINISEGLANIGTTVLADATINDNMSVAGYTILGSSGPSIQQKLIRFYIDSLGHPEKRPHGLLDYKKIIGLQGILFHDTTGTTVRIFNWGYAASTPMATGSTLYADTTNITYYVPANSTALLGDTMRVLITYEQ